MIIIDNDNDNYRLQWCTVVSGPLEAAWRLRMTEPYLIQVSMVSFILLDLNTNNSGTPSQVFGK